MSLVSFDELMSAAEKGGYAVGYFESWDLHSLLAVADAARLTYSPVLLGFSGLYLDHPDRLVQEPLSIYSAMGLELCRQLPVPAALVYNESPNMASVLEAAALGFGLVMYSDETLDLDSQKKRVREAVSEAHRMDAAVEGEIISLPGVGGGLVEPLSKVPMTNVEEAIRFAAETGVDSLAVSLGQMHLHGRQRTKLNFDLLRDLNSALTIPLVLHGASSIAQDDLEAAVALGIRKINFGSILKQAYFEALRAACSDIGEIYNPYVVIGSGLGGDVLAAARQAMRNEAASSMHLIGSAGKAQPSGRVS